MKISYTWLQSHIVEPLPKPEELSETIIMHAFEVEDIERVGDDTVMDIKVLPDRAHDCLSHVGIAREVAGLLGLTLKSQELSSYESIPTTLEVSNNSAVCRRYAGRIIRNVAIKESPEWLRSRLESIGQKSINAVVDATNYVLFDLGQPTHVFDLDKLSSQKIIIRQGIEGESITTLDGKEIALDETIAVISDESVPLAIAGVKGGTKAEVDSNTTNILLEVANFDPVSVRKTARRLGLLTDAAKRFENDLSPQTVGSAMDMLTHMILELAGGTVEGVVDTSPQQDLSREVLFTTSYISEKLGTTISVSEIKAILDRYQYEYREEGEDFALTVPYWRLDITGPHDMVEEIGRAYGYDKVPPVLPELSFLPEIKEPFGSILRAKADLLSRGYREVMTYTFTKKGAFEVARGPKGKSALRANLSDAIRESYEKNRLNAPVIGIDETKIFEIGSVFPETGEEIHVAWMDSKGVTEMSLNDFLESTGSDRGTELVVKTLSVDHTFKAWSEFPHVVRDIAMWVPVGTRETEVTDLMKEHHHDLIVSGPRLFDRFEKDGQQSFAFRYVFQAKDRTLTDAEVNAACDPILGAIQARNWKIR